LGANGNDPDGALDCIWLVYHTLDALEIPTPPFNPDWYEQPTWTVLRTLYRWGTRVDGRLYTGDVVLLPENRWAFGVLWRNGVMHMSHKSSKVDWCPLERLPANTHYFRMKSKSVNSQD
jgi:hypothetical protein